MVDETRILVTESIVVLAPDMRGQQVIERCDPASPWQLRGYLQPLGMLVEHGVDNMDKRFITVEQPVPARQQIALQPALALMFAQHFHHASGGREKFVVR